MNGAIVSNNVKLPQDYVMTNLCACACECECVCVVYIISCVYVCDLCMHVCVCVCVNLFVCVKLSFINFVCECNYNNEHN